MSPLLKGAAALLFAASTEPTLSITAENAKGQAWSVGDEGSDTVNARFTITNPASHGRVTSVVPQPAPDLPDRRARRDRGPASPAIPAGGYSLASGQSTSFTVPYKVTGSRHRQPQRFDHLAQQHRNERGRAESWASLSIPLGSALTGTVKLAADTSRAAARVPVTVTGTNSASGTAVNKTAITDASGKYKFNARPRHVQGQPRREHDADRGRQLGLRGVGWHVHREHESGPNGELHRGVSADA